MLYVFDADGTLRRCTVRGRFCPHRSGEWEPIPGVRSRIKAIDWSRHDFAIASNQGGVAAGHLSAGEAEALLFDLVEAVGVAPLGFSPSRGIRFCPHAAADPPACSCRKPAPRMLVDLMREHDAATWETVFVGDSATDELAARAAGCLFAWAWDFFGRSRAEWIDLIEEKSGRDPRARATFGEDDVG